jgi:hypothetical protein
MVAHPYVVEALLLGLASSTLDTASDKSATELR